MRKLLIILPTLFIMTACNYGEHTRSVWDSCRARGTNEIGCAVVGFGAALADPWVR